MTGSVVGDIVRCTFYDDRILFDCRVKAILSEHRIIVEPIAGYGSATINEKRVKSIVSSEVEKVKL